MMLPHTLVDAVTRWPVVCLFALSFVSMSVYFSLVSAVVTDAVLRNDPMMRALCRAYATMRAAGPTGTGGLPRCPGWHVPGHRNTLAMCFQRTDGRVVGNPTTSR